MLMRLERGAVLRTHHQMGLRRAKSSPGMSAKHSPASNTLPRQSGRINPTPTSNQIMEQKSNTHKRTTTHQRSTRRGKNSSKMCVEFSCSLQERSMGDYSPLSALLRPKKQTQQREQWSYASSYWTSCHARC